MFTEEQKAKFKTWVATIPDWSVWRMTQHVIGESFGWVAILVLHSATIPNLLAYKEGLIEQPMDFDVVVFIWSALVLMFIKGLVNREWLNTITIGIGFIVQAVLLGILVFR
jgi:hypothetical protein